MLEFPLVMHRFKLFDPVKEYLYEKVDWLNFLVRYFNYTKVEIKQKTEKLTQKKYWIHGKTKCNTE